MCYGAQQYHLDFGRGVPNTGESASWCSTAAPAPAPAAEGRKIDTPQELKDGTYGMWELTGTVPDRAVSVLQVGMDERAAVRRAYSSVGHRGVMLSSCCTPPAL